MAGPPEWAARLYSATRVLSWLRTMHLHIMEDSMMTTPSSKVPSAVEQIPEDLPWWRLLNRYHWFVFAMASLAWLFDCLDQQIFIIARNPALSSLRPWGTSSDMLKLWGGRSTAIFIAGWATGGLFFGAIGDRIGRARTLALTVLLYSVC